jgi:uncharacterized membrane protein YecN with MAPEG domain
MPAACPSPEPSVAQRARRHGRAARHRALALDLVMIADILNALPWALLIALGIIITVATVRGRGPRP